MRTAQGDRVISIRKDFNGSDILGNKLDDYFCILKTSAGYRWSSAIIPSELIADYPGEIQRVLKALKEHKRYPLSMAP